MKKFHLITYHPTENGYDEKEDLDTMKEVNLYAKYYLKTQMAVFVLSRHQLVKVFDEQSKRGRKPYSFEIKKFLC